MFSLVITLIAIALVVALALATVYFGGAAMQRGADAARATQLVNQSTQLMGALDLFQADHGRWPDSLQELVPDYLVEIPSRVLSAASSSAGLALSVADASTPEAAWSMPQSGVPLVRLTSMVSETLCREVNQMSRGDDGILTQARPTFRVQCYGQDLASLKVVVGRHPSSFESALPPSELSNEPAPSSSSDAGWLAPPSDGASGSSDSSGGSSTPSQTPAEAACAAVSLPTGWVNSTYECPIVVYRNRSGLAAFDNIVLQGGYPEGTPFPGADGVTATIPGLTVEVTRGYGVTWGTWQGSISAGITVTSGWGALAPGARVLGTVTVRSPDGTFTYPIEFRNEDVALPPKLPGGIPLS